MNKEWQKYLDMASGLREATQKRAESVVRTLVKQGEIATDRAEKAVDELLSRSESNRKAISGIVRSEIEKAVERLGLVRQKDLKALERKVEKLERAAGGTGAAKTSSKKSSKPPPVKAAKKATKKSAAAKRAARQTAANKTTQRARPPKDAAPPASPTTETP